MTVSEFMARPVQERLFVYSLEANVTAHLFGKPGVGKTAFVESWARKTGHVCRTVSAPHVEVGDLAGFPLVVKDEEGTFTDFAQVKWIHDLNKAEKAVLFIDELGLGSQDVRKALLSILEGRIVGSHRIADHVRLIVASNPLAWSFESSPLSPAMRTRIIRIDWELDHDDWILNHRNGYADWEPPTRPAGAALMGDTKCFAIDGALSQNSSLIETESIKNIDPEEPYPTARSWDKAFAVTREILAGDEDAFQKALHGTVGRETGERVFQLTRYTFDTQQIIMEPSSFNWVTEPADRVYAVLLSVVDVVSSKANNYSPSDAEAVCVAAAEAGKADLAWVFLARLMNKFLTFENSPEAAELFADYLVRE
jgi:hypothetical protein